MSKVHYKEEHERKGKCGFKGMFIELTTNIDDITCLRCEEIARGLTQDSPSIKEQWPLSTSIS